MNESLKNRVALVTGASRGLGAAIAQSLAACGAKVAVNYHASAAKAEALCASIRSTGGTAEPFKADVTDEADCAALVAAVREKLGEVDVLVLNATGDQPFIKIEDLTWQAMLDQLDFFVKSPVFMTQQVLAHMKEKQWGRIINIGSEVMELGNAEFSNYVAAKGAQLGLTRSWANELAGDNITVNLVAPGCIPTERHADVPSEELEGYRVGVPMKKHGDPADIGEAVAFLASDSAKFITGQKLSVNGGNTWC